jgi:cobalamin biosynthetic protein CobC
VNSQLIKQDISLATGAPSMHGGDIVSASAHYNIAQEHWIDLSTGLNPSGYPSTGIPEKAFSQLPYLQPEFLTNASEYYGSACFMPLIGSQMLIQALPSMLQNKPVLLPDVGYSEHRDSWQAAGYDCIKYPAFSQSAMIESIDHTLSCNSAVHLVVINPNNPSGVLIDPEQLLIWAKKLDQDCFMVVDEAFIDLTPKRSVLALTWPANMLVLRSFGKFFGLAGIRIGFAFAQGDLAKKITDKLGLWMINGPAQYISAKAFADTHWQLNARLQLAASAQYTQSLFKPLFEVLAKIERIEKQCDSDLFSAIEMPLVQAIVIQEHFCRAGILIRVISLNEIETKRGRALLRIGVLDRENSVHSSKVKDCVSSYIQDIKNT